MILVGNKIDLISERVLELDVIKEFANKYNINAYETSAKTGKEVVNIFLEIAKKLFKKKEIGRVIPKLDKIMKKKRSHRLTVEAAKEKPPAIIANAEN